MNKVILMGRLTRDPEVRYSAGENSTCIARYTLAVDRRFSRGNSNDNDGNNADFIPCVAFGKSGEFSEKYLKKGTKIAVTGRIQTGSYTNKDGNKVYTTEVVIEEQEFAESRNTQNGGGQSGGYSGNNYAQNGGYGQGNGGYSQNNGYGQNGAQRGNQQQSRNSGSSAQGQNQGGGSYQGTGRQPYGNPSQGGYRNSGGQQYGNPQQGQYQNGGQYGGTARGQYQQGSMSSDLDGFMNIPDGAEESLPFA